MSEEILDIRGHYEVLEPACKRSEATLKVTAVATVSAPNTTVPDLTGKTITRDFRYRQQKGNRIYNGAVCTQEPGGWRSATDPVLLKEAEAYPAHVASRENVTR